MKIILKIFTILLLPGIALAKTYNIEDGFYSGIDPVKFDENQFDVDNSVASAEKPVDGKYYGYKFSGRGFFLAPEAFRRVNTSSLQVKDFGNSEGLAAEDNLNYDIKANIGYEFNSNVSGFITYDVGSFSYDSTERSAAIGSSNDSTIGFGSQVNVLDDFKLKVTYEQKEIDDTAINGGKIKSDFIRFGTSYSF
jgi:hypothetical protein